MQIKTNLQHLPSVENILSDPVISELNSKLGRVFVAGLARVAVEQIRKELLELDDKPAISKDALKSRIINAIQSHAAAASRFFYRKAVNATGIILHTGLGRAVLPKCVLEQIQGELAGYSVLQIDLESGARSKRDSAVAQLLCELTGAQAATVVNNNAAATAIVLNTIGEGKEIIVSRGQLVEIGGSFRLPDVMASSGVKLVEVGTTNKTHARDYIEAINENTAAIMRVHPSNYRITGFTSEVSLTELIDIAHGHNLPLIDDVGAGALIDFSQFGFEYEPLLSDSIKAGADIVTCSGDKLIGACQAGIILGNGELIKKIQKNPFARIVRVDKVTLAALEATLKLFRDQKTALEQVPTLAMLRRPLSELEAAASRIVSEVNGAGLKAEIIDGFSQMGSGSLPDQNLPTKLVAVSHTSFSVDQIAFKLRMHEPPVVSRIQHNKVLLDPRTMLEGDHQIVIQALKGLQS